MTTTGRLPSAIVSAPALELENPYKGLRAFGEADADNFFGRGSLTQELLGRPGCENWFIVDFMPGPHPLEELEAALLRVATNPPDSLLVQLRENERGLLRAVKRILPADESVELALVIDQFEELFTLVAGRVPLIFAYHRRLQSFGNNPATPFA